jgi:hypothetical protein
MAPAPDPRANAQANAGRGRLRPALLSGLVFPGLGQLVVGHVWRALFFGGSSIALLALVVRRVIGETQRMIPEDPDALLDPTLPFRLALEVQRANAAFFLWATLGVVALWAGSIADAWLSSRRGTAATGARAGLDIGGPE